MHEYSTAAMSGLGAVMGSKNLKAIAVRGTKGVEIADVDRFLQANERFYETIKANEMFEEWEKYGTSLDVDMFYRDRGHETFGNYESIDWPSVFEARGQPFIDKYQE